MGVVTSAVIGGVAAAAGAYEAKRGRDRQERAAEKAQERAKSIEADQRAQRERERKKRAKLQKGGFRGTILTTTNEQEDSERKTLLGG